MRASTTDWVAYVGLYIPALIAWMLYSAPVLSYGAAWLGSIWILWLSVTGRVRSLPKDRAWTNQLFRPLFLAQGMFAGYLCLSSVFYVWELASGGIGYGGIGIEYIAAAQRYSVLGHAALVHGILATVDYRRSGEWKFSITLPLQRVLLGAGAGAVGLSFAFAQLPGLGVFAGKLQILAGVSTIVGSAYAVRRRDGPMIAVGLMLYGWILLESFLSGWKETPIVVLGLLLAALYPKYKKTVATAGVGFLIFVVTVLPAYNSTFRQLNWHRGVEAEQAAREAIERIETGQVDFGETAWSFLGERLAVIKQLAQYVSHTPSERPYYGLSIAVQGARSIVPRVFWSGKPNTERLAMERAYENRVVASTSSVSAKPSVIADGYLSGGAIGVFLACFLLGCTAGWASRLAERWFGGYAFGGQVVFVGLFAGQLLTASFEFLISTLFWSFVLMGLLATGLWVTGLLHWTGEHVSTRLASAARP